MPLSDKDRLRHLMIELEWADREHPEFTRRLLTVTPLAQAAEECAHYVAALPHCCSGGPQAGHAWSCPSLP